MKSKAKGNPRHTKQQIETAHKIANDLSEGVDAGESRSTLRAAIAYWADEATDQHRERETAESILRTIIAAKLLNESVLSSAEQHLRRCRKR